MIQPDKHHPDPEEWVRHYGDILFAYAMKRTGDRQTSEDLVQETFLTALQKKETFRGNSRFRTWLIAILRNKISDWYRQRYKQAEDPGDHFDPFRRDQAAYGAWKATSAPQPWDTEQSEDQTARLREWLLYCLSLLPEKWRIVFMMKYAEEEKGDNICAECNISASNLWVILHRARMKMRDCMEKKQKQ